MRKNVVTLHLLLIAAALFLSCRSETPSGSSNSTAGAPEVKGKKMEIKVTSAAFQDDGMIPKEFTCVGANLSPPLSWDSVPEKTRLYRNVKLS